MAPGVGKQTSTSISGRATRNCHCDVYGFHRVWSVVILAIMKIFLSLSRSSWMVSNNIPKVPAHWFKGNMTINSACQQRKTQVPVMYCSHRFCCLQPDVRRIYRLVLSLFACCTLRREREGELLTNLPACKAGYSNLSCGCHYITSFFSSFKFLNMITRLQNNLYVDTLDHQWVIVFGMLLEFWDIDFLRFVDIWSDLSLRSRSPHFIVSNGIRQGKSRVTWDLPPPTDLGTDGIDLHRECLIKMITSRLGSSRSLSYHPTLLSGLFALYTHFS